MMTDTADRDAVTYREFLSRVNMTATELEDWLKTEASQSVGRRKTPDGESVGHRAGRRSVAILLKDAADLTDEDRAHMRKVCGYIKRHLAQRPTGKDRDLRETRWRHSLMNWGHDPLKAD